MSKRLSMDTDDSSDSVDFPISPSASSLSFSCSPNSTSNSFSLDSILQNQSFNLSSPPFPKNQPSLQPKSEASNMFMIDYTPKEEELEQEEMFDQMDSKISITCTNPTTISTAQEVSQRVKSLKTDHDRNFVLQSILSTCTPSQLQFVSKLIHPFLQRDFIATLPTELSICILSYLDPYSLCQASLVSKKWYRLVNDESLWRKLFGQYHFELSSDYKFFPHFTWKAIFKYKYRVHYNWVKGGNSLTWNLNGNVEGVVTCLIFDKKRIITGSDDRTIRIWSTETGEMLRVVIFFFFFLFLSLSFLLFF